MSEFKARPTTYRGIRMRSRLEAGFAAWLDAWHFEWEYEPQAYADQRGQYLPDFLLHEVKVYLGDEPFDAPVFVEVKPDPFKDWATFAAQAAIICESVKGAFVGVAQPKSSDRLLMASDSGPYPMHWAVIEEFGSMRMALVMRPGDSERPWPPRYWVAGR